MIDLQRREAPRTGAEIRGIVARFAPEVSPNARAILLYLWTYARPMEEPAIAYPSAVTIGRELGVSDRKVRDNLARLEAVGAVERARHDRRNVWILHRTPASGSAKSGRQRPIQDPDPTGAEPDASVRENRTPASTKDQGKNKLEEQDHSRGVQAPMPWAPPEPPADDVAELWELQDRLRRECDPHVRSLAMTSKRRRAVAARVAEQGREACEHVLRVYAAEAKRKASIQWFNGVTNWRPDNFDRALSRQPGAEDTPPTRGGFTPRDGTDMDGGARAGLRLVRE